MVFLQYSVCTSTYDTYLLSLNSTYGPINSQWVIGTMQPLRVRRPTLSSLFTFQTCQAAIIQAKFSAEATDLLACWRARSEANLCDEKGSRGREGAGT